MKRIDKFTNKQKEKLNQATVEFDKSLKILKIKKKEKGK